MSKNDKKKVFKSFESKVNKERVAYLRDKKNFNKICLNRSSGRGN
jgi:hypothetical protein